jgi:hypothetical protein
MLIQPGEDLLCFAVGVGQRRSFKNGGGKIRGESLISSPLDGRSFRASSHRSLRIPRELPNLLNFAIFENLFRTKKFPHASENRAAGI